MPRMPETKYARSGEISIAYQVIGEGPIDLIHTPGFVSNVEFSFGDPAYVRYFERLATFARVIRFDKRGTGLSDRDCGIPNLEERIDDIRAVMDAAGIERAVLMGVSEGGPMSVLFAATYPSRVSGLILYGCGVRTLWDEDYPWGTPLEDFDKGMEGFRDHWGERESMAKRIRSWLIPSRGDDEAYLDFMTQMARSAASPRAAAALRTMNRDIDVRSVLPSISVPTICLWREGDQAVKSGQMEFMASRIPNARYKVMPGRDHLEWGEGSEELANEIEQFVTGKRSAAVSDRVLATVMFTDIVDSTKLASLCGDQRWRELREQHDAISLHSIERFRGRAVKQTGDGFLAIFDGPIRSIQCAKTIRDEVRTLGIEIRAGLHTGELDLVGEDVSGIAVNTAARVMSLAPGSEVAVSRTVRDLVAGSDLTFVELGTHELKGIPGEWQVYQVA